MLMAAMSANIHIAFENATEGHTFGFPPDFAATLTKGKSYKCDLQSDGELVCAWKDGFSISFNNDVLVRGTLDPIRII